MKKESMKNYLEKYIENNSNLSKKSIKDKLFILCVIGIPTCFLGINKSITIPIIIVFILTITIWGILVLRNGQEQQILYTGVYFIMVSIVFLIASYKIFSINRKIQDTEILFVLSIYILSIIIYNIFMIRNISKKEYSRKKNNMVYIFSASIFGMVIGKSIFGNVVNNQAITIVGSLLLLLALIFGFGTKMIIIYYLAKKHKLLK